MKKNKNIEYGDVDFQHDQSKAKIRITTMISSDVLSLLKEEAKILGIGYQTLLDAKLREILFGDAVDVNERSPLLILSKKVEKLDREIKKLKKRSA